MPGRGGLSRRRRGRGRGVRRFGARRRRQRLHGDGRGCAGGGGFVEGVGGAGVGGRDGVAAGAGVGLFAGGFAGAGVDGPGSAAADRGAFVFEGDRAARRSRCDGGGVGDALADFRRAVGGFESGRGGRAHGDRRGSAGAGRCVEGVGRAGVRGGDGVDARRAVGLFAGGFAGAGVDGLGFAAADGGAFVFEGDRAAGGDGRDGGGVGDRFADAGGAARRLQFGRGGRADGDGQRPAAA